VAQTATKSFGVVDFYGVGDLMRAVDKLNGASPPDQGG
jgi:hypothetical protein